MSSFFTVEYTKTLLFFSENWFVRKLCKRLVAPPAPVSRIVLSGTYVLALLLLVLRVEFGKKMLMLIPASLSICLTHLTNVSFDGINSLSANFTKWQITDEFFECVWPFCGIGTSRVKWFVQ